jgi:hypothetical protein
VARAPRWRAGDRIRRGADRDRRHPAADLGVQHPHVANQRKALIGRLCTHDEDVGPGELHDPDCIVT